MNITKQQSIETFNIFKIGTGLNGTDQKVNLAKVYGIDQLYKCNKRQAQLIVNVLNRECNSKIENLYYMKKV